MDRFIAMIIITVEPGLPGPESGYLKLIKRANDHEREDAMTESSMHALLSAIGCENHAEHLPSLVEPLPRELEDLIAQLVAFEIGKRGSTERSVEVLPSSIVHPRPQS
jgi:hypothetical protein